MSVSNLKIGRQKFVVVPEREFARLRQENESFRQLLQEDHLLGEIARKELKSFRKSGSKGIPWEQVKKELGI